MTMSGTPSLYKLLPRPVAQRANHATQEYHRFERISTALRLGLRTHSSTTPVRSRRLGFLSSDADRMAPVETNPDISVTYLDLLLLERKHRVADHDSVDADVHSIGSYSERRC